MEQPLAPNSSCNLSSINLSEYVLDPFTNNARFNLTELSKDIPYIVKAMDDVLEENLPNHALVQQTEMATKFRNLGIGVMGLADTLVKLQCAYGSDESKQLIKHIIKEIFRVAVKSSVKLAEERGNFPGYNSKIWDSQILKLAFTDSELKEFKEKDKLRNCSLLSIAPTGSIGSMLNVSTGVEPFFMLSYKRKTVSLNKDKETYYDVDIKTLSEYKKIYNDVPDCFVKSVSSNISYKDRIDVQAILQDYIDTAISSTINLPKETTVEEVKDLYLYAWESGLKGITIYREGSRDPILSGTIENSKNDLQQYNYITPLSRKSIGTTCGQTFCKKSACGTIYCTCNTDCNGNFVELFTHTSKGGTCQANLNAVTRGISLALRSGIKVSEIIDQLKGIHCPACAMSKAKGHSVDGLSCPDIIAKTMEEFTGNSLPKEKKELSNLCPECGNPLIHESGCLSCTNCGFSRCN